MMRQGVAVVLVALAVLELRLASARALPGETAYVARKDCPAPRECCRYLEHSGNFEACCNTYGCCPDCDNIYVYRGHGPYEVRQDCVGAYECCLHPFLSEAFHKCCFEHRCCPVCGSVTDGCYFNNVMYPWRSVVLALPRCCTKLVCGVKLSDASPPYLTAVIVPISHPPTSEDQLCDLVKNDYCVDHLGIIQSDGSEWLENPCRLCRCDNGRVSCHYVPPQDCPPAPQPHCRELPGDCCPSWDCDEIDGRIWSYHFHGIVKQDHRRLRTCIDGEGSVHDFGDQWWDHQDPCVFRTLHREWYHPYKEELSTPPSSSTPGLPLERER
ncbi:uncharacterized protein [Panulirus ornatus]|uniref:uncharacterized protein isoform X4 n=1 Tax=Panulirus ornatus TaxID=150431 RepID=UPI003A875A73